MTAIAAVIALSSTPLFAQSVDTPDVMATPVIDVTPEPVAADPLAAEPVAETPAAADPLAPEAVAKPAARKAAAKPTATRSRPAAARAASAAPAVAAAPASVTVAPMAATPIEPLPTQLEVLPVEAPVAATPAPAEATSFDSMIVAAGIGGLGILALAGAGLVVRRRRRRAEDAENVAYQEYVEALPEAAPEPAMAVEPQPGYMPEQTEPAFVRAFAPAAAAPIVAAEATLGEPAEPIDGPVTELPEGFDLSRFSPNVQAAYKGPTEDNPSLSLKYRLRRASGMDQLEKREADPTSPVEAPAAKPAVARPTKADFMFGSASGKANVKTSVKTSVRPAYTN